MNVAPFSPDITNTKTLAVTASSAQVTIATVDTNTGTTGQGNNVFRIVNAGPGTVFIRWGSATTQTALITDLPMLAGTVEVFSKSPDTTTLAAISATTATLYITSGEGQ